MKILVAMVVAAAPVCRYKRLLLLILIYISSNIFDHILYVVHCCLNCLCLAGLIRGYTRSLIRDKYEIGSSRDCQVVTCCSCCSMIQEYYQLQQDPMIDHMPVYRKVDWTVSLLDVIKGKLI